MPAAAKIKELGKSGREEFLLRHTAGNHLLPETFQVVAVIATVSQRALGKSGWEVQTVQSLTSFLLS